MIFESLRLCVKTPSNSEIVFQFSRTLVQRIAVWIQLAQDDFLIAIGCPHDLKLGTATTTHHNARRRGLVVGHFPEHVMIPIHRFTDLQLICESPKSANL